MKEKRITYSSGYKALVVSMVIPNDPHKTRNTERVATSMGIGFSVLDNWRRTVKAKGPNGFIGHGKNAWTGRIKAEREREQQRIKAEREREQQRIKAKQQAERAHLDTILALKAELVKSRQRIKRLQIAVDRLIEERV